MSLDLEEEERKWEGAGGVMICGRAKKNFRASDIGEAASGEIFVTVSKQGNPFHRVTHISSLLISVTLLFHGLTPLFHFSVLSSCKQSKSSNSYVNDFSIAIIIYPSCN